MLVERKRMMDLSLAATSFTFAHRYHKHKKEKTFSSLSTAQSSTGRSCPSRRTYVVFHRHHSSQMFFSSFVIKPFRLFSVTLAATAAAYTQKVFEHRFAKGYLSTHSTHKNMKTRIKQRKMHEKTNRALHSESARVNFIIYLLSSSFIYNSHTHTHTNVVKTR